MGDMRQWVHKLLKQRHETQNSTSTVSADAAFLEEDEIANVTAESHEEGQYWYTYYYYQHTNVTLAVEITGLGFRKTVRDVNVYRGVAAVIKMTIASELKTSEKAIELVLSEADYGIRGVLTVFLHDSRPAPSCLGGDIAEMLRKVVGISDCQLKKNIKVEVRELTCGTEEDADGDGDDGDGDGDDG
jgi:hypothetical protein